MNSIRMMELDKGARHEHFADLNSYAGYFITTLTS
jgi:hypothetical protein